MYYLGVDLGGTHMAIGVVDQDGRIIAKAETPTLPQRPYQELVADMVKCMVAAMAEAKVTEDDIASIGIGIPGTADRSGVVIFCTNLGWHNIPLREEIQKHINKPVFIDNDANVAGWAEYAAGVSRGTDTSVFLTLGTGVGAGIVINGKLWAGRHNVAAEYGHIVINADDGEPCTCGKTGCTERYCSATAIIRMGREACEKNPGCLLSQRCGGDLDKLNAKIIIDAAKEGDTIANSVFNRYAEYLTIAVNNIISFLDPDMIVLGGGVSHAGEFLLNAVRERLPKYLMFKTLPYAELRQAKLGNDAGIIGAALLGIEQ